jgi:translocation and assembly module TamA
MSATLRLTLHPSSVVVKQPRRLRRGAACCAPTRIARLAALLLFVASPCFAGIEIEITGVTETLERNVRAFISMTRYASRDDLDEETVTRLSRRIPTEVRKALEPLGYYSAAATYTLTPNDKQWTVQIAIDPGRAVRITQSQVEINGPGANDSGLQSVLKRGDLHPARA